MDGVARRQVKVETQFDGSAEGQSRRGCSRINLSPTRLSMHASHSACTDLSCLHHAEQRSAMRCPSDLMRCLERSSPLIFVVEGAKAVRPPQPGNTGIPRKRPKSTAAMASRSCSLSSKHVSRALLACELCSKRSQILKPSLPKVQVHFSLFHSVFQSILISRLSLSISCVSRVNTFELPSRPTLTAQGKLPHSTRHSNRRTTLLNHVPTDGEG